MRDLNESNFLDAGPAMEKWQHYPASSISHHGQDCCRVAREWFLSMDYSQLNAGNPLTGPRWLRQRFTWGPSSWPIHWCEAVRQKTLDCGALAALSHELFLARGVRSFPAQFIEQFSADATRQWCQSWGGSEARLHWVNDELIYHEGCAVAVRGDEVRLWDATAGWWVNPKQFGGYGGVVVVRIFDARANAPATLTWGAHRIRTNEWQKIERARGDFA